MDADSKSSRSFVWDDAAIDENGQLVLIEEEASSIVPVHIEGHLARLKIMMARGENIKCMVWITKQEHFCTLYELLRFYSHWLRPLPYMEVWSQSGKRLGFVEAK